MKFNVFLCFIEFGSASPAPPEWRNPGMGTRRKLAGGADSEATLDDDVEAHEVPRAATDSGPTVEIGCFEIPTDEGESDDEAEDPNSYISSESAIWEGESHDEQDTSLVGLNETRLRKSTGAQPCEISLFSRELTGVAKADRKEELSSNKIVVRARAAHFSTYLAAEKAEGPNSYISSESAIEEGHSDDELVTSLVQGK
jgi:hypothetical protein